MFVAMGGPTGPAGADGAAGAAGVQGEKGDKGDSGAINWTDRGDVAAYDWTTGYFTKDSVWRDLDLSAICPAGTKLVLLRFNASVTSTGKAIYFKTKGNVNDINVIFLNVQVANIIFTGDCWVVPDVNRFIQYKLLAATWTSLNVLVAGYFTG